MTSSSVILRLLQTFVVVNNVQVEVEIFSLEWPEY
jgi:hypothetical protein